ncbi:hypothetical protein GGX14DRAFT_612777 [Mycena pura]|uniref:Uncharacterized protein n=1 Tax=Mycena pura TaxID=153505 RepID=A0AAD7E4I5_9AGAR|nr:hypothetical protein GGX14DRAFT_612777 [Mycena pura]
MLLQETVTLSCVKYIAGVKPAIKHKPYYQRVEALDPDKSTLLRSDKVPPVADDLSNAVLLRTVMDRTSRLLTREFIDNLRFANDRIMKHVLQNPTQTIDLFNRHQWATFTNDEHEESVEFARIISRPPFTASYALLLSSLQIESIVINGACQPIPRIPSEAWRNIVQDHPWVSSYLDSAGENFNEWIHGNTLAPMWTWADLDLALNASSFSSVAYMNNYPCKFLHGISVGGKDEDEDD